jgi:phosphoribosylglycinamide formyltransferase-1
MSLRAASRASSSPVGPRGIAASDGKAEAPGRRQKERCVLSKIDIMVLVSGGGSNFQALYDAEIAGKLRPGRLALAVSDRPGAYALERAKRWGIPVYVQEPDKRLPKGERREELSDWILRIARDNGIGLIVMAGFLSILTGKIIRCYAGRIINLHPSLLPKYGGNGMYGERVHRAVLDAGETESGCTVHLVNAGTDTGSILLQRRVPVLKWDTPGILAERIHGEERIAIVEATAMMAGRLQKRLLDQANRVPEPLCLEISPYRESVEKDKDDNRKEKR